MTARILVSALVLAPMLALTACKKETPKDANASGEILPGSISDAMLPADRVTSQPPLDPGANRSAKPGAGATEDATAAPEASAAAPPEPAATKAAE